MRYVCICGRHVACGICPPALPVDDASSGTRVLGSLDDADDDAAADAIVCVSSAHGELDGLISC
jgi:hypothetical protein